MDVPTRALPGGDELPVIGFGTWDLHGEVLREAIHAALAAGYTHFDTAEGYRNEATIGDVLANADVAREELFLTSKALPKHLGYESLIEACEATLDRLETDYLDLYLIHWPNPAISVRETLSAMATLHDEGLVRNVGVSNFSPYHLSAASHVSDVPIAVNQIEFHPYYQQTALRDYAAEIDTVIEAAAPLARTEVLGDETVHAIAEKHGVSPAQVVLKWELDHGAVVLPKSSSPEHIRANFRSLDVSLDAGDHDRLDALARDNPVYYDEVYDWTGDTYGIPP